MMANLFEEEKFSYPILEETSNNNMFQEQSFMDRLASKGQGVASALMAIDPFFREGARVYAQNQANIDRQRNIDIGRQRRDKQRMLENVYRDKIFDYNVGKDVMALQEAQSAGQEQALNDMENKIYSRVKDGLMTTEQAQQELAKIGIERQVVSPPTDTTQARNIQDLIDRGFSKEQAIMAVYNPNTEMSAELLGKELQAELTPYEKTFQTTKAKKDVEKQAGIESAEEMKSTALQSMDRALKAVDSGSGIGIIGGNLANLGLNFAKDAGSNYADIESANASMNALLRQKLQATGLTGSELNSGVEANAYRYTIAPTDNEDVIRQKINNFKSDHIENDSKLIIPSEDLTALSDDDLLKGL